MAPKSPTKSHGVEEAQVKTERPRKTVKQRTLELISSLNADDDERATISKKLSWILRHGARQVRCPMDEDGWVKISDLLSAEIMEDIPESKLMAVIAESNLQKARYELKNGADGKLIKAISKTQRKGAPDEAKRAAVTAETSVPSEVKLRPEAKEFVPQMPQPGQMAPTSPVSAYYPYGGCGFGMGYSPYMNPYMNQQATAMMAAQQVAMTGRCRGKIKFFNADKGFGFIESPEAHARFGRDVFIHKADFEGFKVGQDVIFKVETNKDGMPQAREIAAGIPGSTPTMPKGKGKGKEGGKGKDGGKGKGTRNDAKKGDKKDKKQPEKQEGADETAEAAPPPPEAVAPPP